jgi:hypothetical protein
MLTRAECNQRLAVIDILWRAVGNGCHCPTSSDADVVTGVGNSAAACLCLFLTGSLSSYLSLPHSDVDLAVLTNAQYEYVLVMQLRLRWYFEQMYGVRWDGESWREKEMQRARENGMKGCVEEKMKRRKDKEKIKNKKIESKTSISTNTSFSANTSASANIRTSTRSNTSTCISTFSNPSTSTSNSTPLDDFSRLFERFISFRNISTNIVRADRASTHPSQGPRDDSVRCSGSGIGSESDDAIVSGNPDLICPALKRTRLCCW